VLNDCNIDKAGEPEDLQKKCNKVKELDLAQNKLDNWNEVFVILSHMPRVEFVNLSLNRLEGPIEAPPVCRMDRLRSLVLNNTKLDWYAVESLLNLLPVLEELHLSLNEYTEVLIDTIENDFDDIQVEEDTCTCSQNRGYKRTLSETSMYKKTNAHEGVKKLHLTGNPITDWNEICRVGRVFPNLEALVLADCPLK
jgi:hypothetical protein